VAKRKGKEDWVMECDKEKTFLIATLHHPVFLFLSLCHTSSPNLPFPFSLPHFITQSSFSFLFAIIYHPVFPFLSRCHTPSPNLLFPFSLPHFITMSSFSFKCGNEKGKGRLGDEVWQRERKRKTG
jgi:hypothetical protein